MLHLAHARHSDRRCVNALTQRRVLERLDVNDDVRVRERTLDRVLDRIRAAACPCPTAAPGEMAITTSAN